MTTFPYQIALLGAYQPYRDAIEATIVARFRALGLDSHIAVLRGESVLARERRAPCVGIFFGSPAARTTLYPELDDLLSDSVVVLPVVDDIRKFTSLVPSSLAHVNGVGIDPADPGFEHAVATLMESFRLLRRDRRVFVSYRRDDSRAAAVQVYERLDQQRFDVFLDTIGVPPASDFQSTLWHRLADTDVVVLLDTADFLGSRWTEEELARANATNIQILHVLWPGCTPSSTAGLNHFFPLTANMFVSEDQGKDGLLRSDVLDRISTEVEALRARAIAARHRYLVDAFCDEARRRGFSADVQPNRHIVLDTGRQKIAVVPVVGVPNALRLHDVERELSGGGHGKGSVWALYDERGLLSEIIDHLDWLNSSLPIEAVSVMTVTVRLDRTSAP